MVVRSHQTEGRDKQAKLEAGEASTQLSVFDLRKLTSFRVEGPNVQVLSDSDKARIVLFAFKSGQQLKEHTTSSQIIVQTLRGRTLFTSGSTSVTMQSGRIVQLEENIPHSVVALTDAVVLVTMVPSPVHHSLF
jgi:quercetin dioxygenase-like cupin family protein